MLKRMKHRPYTSPKYMGINVSTKNGKKIDDFVHIASTFRASSNETQHQTEKICHFANDVSHVNLIEFNCREKCLDSNKNFQTWKNLRNFSILDLSLTYNILPKLWNSMQFHTLRHIWTYIPQQAILFPHHMWVLKRRRTQNRTAFAPSRLVW